MASVLHQAQQARLTALRAAVDCDAILLADLPTTFWLSGSMSDQLLLITADHVVTDPAAIGELLRSMPAKATVGCDRGVSLEAWQSLTGSAPLRPRSVSAVVRVARSIKDVVEIALLKRAAEVATCAALDALELGRNEDVSEIEVAAHLETVMYDDGSHGHAFPPSVAYGARAVHVWNRPSPRRRQPGEGLLIDCGASIGGYRSDVCVSFAGADPAAAYALRVVDDALVRLCTGIVPGMTGKEVHEAAQALLRAAGIDAKMPHAVGHGIGLEVHELPRLGSADDDLIEPGQVLAIEPGVYAPGAWGVRTERMVLVTENGVQPLGWTFDQLEQSATAGAGGRTSWH